MNQMKDLQNPLERWISNFIGNCQEIWFQKHPGRVTGVPWISENTWRSPSSSTGAEATVNTHNSSFGSTLAIACNSYQNLPETRWPESFLWKHPDVFFVAWSASFIGYPWSLFGIEVEKWMNKFFNCWVQTVQTLHFFLNLPDFRVATFWSIKNTQHWASKETQHHSFFCKFVGPSFLLKTSSISFPTLPTFTHLNSPLDSPWGPNMDIC